MTLPDPIERGEAACERWADENVRGDIAMCSCGRAFKLSDGRSISSDPYAIPVCTRCFDDWYRSNAMAETTHLPLPWRVESYTSAIGDIKYLNIIADNGAVVCSTWNAEEDDAAGQDAEYELIVRVCNSHDKLVEACQAALEVLEDITPTASLEEIEPWLDKKLRAALALAEPEPNVVELEKPLQIKIQELRHHAVLNWKLSGTCQCGARIESPKNWPHVTGCPVGEAIELESETS